jgi:RNA polymerase sigma-70 factor (ECF subfamily)
LGFLRRRRDELCAAGSASGPDPSDPSSTAETIYQVHSAIRQLPQRDREIIVLRYLEELPIEEIAKTLSLSRPAADVRLTRARQRLEKILKPVLEK